MSLSVAFAHHAEATLRTHPILRRTMSSIIQRGHIIYG
jgi:hypothetical protein